jgi:hypothetical protein
MTQHTCNEGDDCALFDVDPLITATVALEVAVDEYNASEYRFANRASIGGSAQAWRRSRQSLQERVNDAVRDFFNAVQDAGVERLPRSAAEYAATRLA